MGLAVGVALVCDAVRSRLCEPRGWGRGTTGAATTTASDGEEEEEGGTAEEGSQADDAETVRRLRHGRERVKRMQACLTALRTFGAAAAAADEDDDDDGAPAEAAARLSDPCTLRAKGGVDRVDGGCAPLTYEK